MMNSTDSCNIDCLEMVVGFWVEGVILPVIAALGIIGQDTFLGGGTTDIRALSSRLVRLEMFHHLLHGYMIFLSFYHS